MLSILIYGNCIAPQPCPWCLVMSLEINCQSTLDYRFERWKNNERNLKITWIWIKDSDTIFFTNILTNSIYFNFARPLVFVVRRSLGTATIQSQKCWIIVVKSNIFCFTQYLRFFQTRDSQLWDVHNSPNWLYLSIQKQQFIR